jgi:short-subunit dehydrogenase
VPFIGAYAGSKHALEGMSDSLRRELQLHDVDVINLSSMRHSLIIKSNL